MRQNREAELLAAAGCGDVAALEALLPAAGDLSAFAGPHGVTPLMVAAAGGHVAAVTILLQRGSSPSRRDEAGRSAADHARTCGHAHLATRLDGIVDQEQTLW